MWNPFRRHQERFELIRALDTLRTDLERRLDLLERDAATFAVERNHLIGNLTSLEARVRQHVHRLHHVPQTAKDNGAILDHALAERKGFK